MTLILILNEHKFPTAIDEVYSEPSLWNYLSTIKICLRTFIKKVIFNLFWLYSDIVATTNNFTQQTDRL